MFPGFLDRQEVAASRRAKFLGDKSGLCKQQERRESTSSTNTLACHIARAASPLSWRENISRRDKQEELGFQADKDITDVGDVSRRSLSKQQDVSVSGTTEQLGYNFSSFQESG